jgi:aryl-alcohol dehydrogenase-like predicted oxidoreductase
MSLEKRKLGNSDLELTRIGFGAWAIGGGDWAFGWGPQDDADSIEAIHRAIDLGINWIDTAAVYGLGHSEEVVGKALKTASSKPYIFTKSSMVWNEQREITNSMKQIRREVEDSLKRLQVEAIDLYQIHWPKPDEEIEEGWATMADLKKEGKVRWIGVSNFSVAQMERAMKYAPMHSGLLTGAMTKERVAAFPSDDFRRNAKSYQQPALDRNLKLADLLKQIGSRHGVSAGVVAIAWTLEQPAITAAIVGSRSAKQVEGTLAAASFKLTPAELTEINEYLVQNP